MIRLEYKEHCSPELAAMLKTMEAIGEYSFPEPDDTEAFEAMRTAGQFTWTNLPEVKVEKLDLNGVHCELLTPKTVKAPGIIMYIHGGGWCTGDCVSSRGYAAPLADASGMRVATVSYRLAPENKWPAQIIDCFTAYKCLMAKFPGEEISLVGDSAGGHLCLVTSLMARDKGIRLPACIVPVSAATNLAENLPSRFYNAGALVMGAWNGNDFIRQMLLPKMPGVDLRHPYVSPFYGNFSGFPPMLFIADEDELLFDETKLLADRVERNGGCVERIYTSGVWHAFACVGNTCPESVEILKLTADFIKKNNTKQEEN